METEKMKVTRGIYAGILNPHSGELLLTRRTISSSIISGVSFRGNWELVGGAVMASGEGVAYDHYVHELCRIIETKIGVAINIRGFYPMYSMVFKGPNGYDEASVIPLVRDVKPTIGETLWVSPTNLRILAEAFEPADEGSGKSGKGLVSGIGKRMHCMGLCALTHSPLPHYGFDARVMLRNILAA